MSTPDPTTGGKTSTRFDDRVAIGVYFYGDVHRMVASICPLPAYFDAPHHDVLPYFLPARALTHADAPNLLVAGKSMAQSFWANAATRLHPEEWGTGVAAGAAASLMVARGWSTTTTLLANVGDLQDVLRSPLAQSPLEWTLP